MTYNTPENIDLIIAELGIVLLNNETIFEEKAREFSQQILPEELNYLKHKFHNPPQIHKNINEQELGLGQWMAVCQYVIFELIYNLEVKYTLPLLRNVAFGEYDWTQATALTVLCRLYINERVDAKVFKEILQKIPEMRYETHLYFGRALLSREKTDVRYKDIILQIQDDSFKEALEELKESTNK